MNPRETFRQSAHAKRWLDVVDGAQFQAAATAAMLHMQFTTPFPQSTVDAQAQAYMMIGAQRFLQILMGLTLSDADTAKKKDFNLIQHTKM